MKILPGIIGTGALICWGIIAIPGGGITVDGTVANVDGNCCKPGRTDVWAPNWELNLLKPNTAFVATASIAWIFAVAAAAATAAAVGMWLADAGP